MSLVRYLKNAAPYGVARDGVSEVDLDNALDYYDGYANKDRMILEDALIRRYATRIKKTGSSTVDGDEITEYVAADIKDAVQRGRQEIVLTRFYRRLVGVAANLFTEPAQRFTYSDGENKIEDVDDTLKEYRTEGEFLKSVIRADRLSVALGSSVFYVYWQGGLRYQAIAPQCVLPLYASEIEDNEDTRQTDTTNIDEASGWIINLGSSGDASLYVAYIGASDKYPMGRCVRYESDDPKNIPSVGDTAATDHYLPNGDIGNPLTAVRASLSDEDSKNVPEYPLSIFLGSDAGTDTSLLPTTGLSLYKDAVEIDMAWSRLAMTSLKSARGVYILKNDMYQALPKNPDEGIVLLTKGQDLQTAGVGATNSKDASEVIRGIQSAIAESWNVPSHEVTTGIETPESGIALYIRSQPKLRFRNERIRLNASAVSRIFAIERALIYAAEGSDAIPWGVSQQWNAGEFNLPVSEKERIEGLKLALDSGVIDRVEFIRSYHRLATSDEAIALLQQMADRSAELPQLPTGQGQPASGRQAAIQRLRGGA